MSFWRKLKIKIRNRWHDTEYMATVKTIFLIVLIMFIWALYIILKRAIETDSFDKILPWLKMFSFSTSVVFGYIFIISILPGIILYNLNKKIYHEKSIIAWIPVANIYLLGKLTINKKSGILLVLGFIIAVSSGIPSILFIIYISVLVVLLIYAVIKLIKNKY